MQRGLRGTELFVSIIGNGTFGFDTGTVKDRYYIAEKLEVKGQPTIDKLAELINGIIAELNYEV